jgi:hypothetical protein
MTPSYLPQMPSAFGGGFSRAMAVFIARAFNLPLP